MRLNTRDDLPRLIKAYSIPEPNSGCWLWERGSNEQGYGKIKISGKTILAHRASYLAFFENIPVGLSICHRCDCPPCVNPDHLFPGTSADNHADRNQKGRQARGDKQGLRVHPESAPKGERNGSARLTEIEVIRIRERLRQGAAVGALASEYCVSKAAIRFIQWRRTWRHL